MYGAPYKKPTHLWSNCPHFRPRTCNKRCWFWDGKRHAGSAQRSANRGDSFKGFSMHELYKMPGPLCDDMAWANC